MDHSRRLSKNSINKVPEHTSPFYNYPRNFQVVDMPSSINMTMKSKSIQFGQDQYKGLKNVCLPQKMQGK